MDDDDRNKRILHRNHPQSLFNYLLHCCGLWGKPYLINFNISLETFSSYLNKIGLHRISVCLVVKISVAIAIRKKISGTR